MTHKDFMDALAAQTAARNRYKIALNDSLATPEAQREHLLDWCGKNDAVASFFRHMKTMRIGSGWYRITLLDFTYEVFASGGHWHVHRDTVKDGELCCKLQRLKDAKNYIKFDVTDRISKCHVEVQR